MNEFLVLYEDRSGVQGRWVYDKTYQEYRFYHSLKDVALSSIDMKYLLKELSKAKRKANISEVKDED